MEWLDQMGQHDLTAVFTSYWTVYQEIRNSCIRHWWRSYSSVHIGSPSSLFPLVWWVCSCSSQSTLHGVLPGRLWRGAWPRRRVTGPPSLQPVTRWALFEQFRSQVGLFSGGLSCLCFVPGVPGLWDLLPDGLRWSWCHSNRNKMHNKCSALLIIMKLSSPTPGPWKNFLPWNWLVVLVVKDPPANTGDLRDGGLIPGLGGALGGGHGNPL